MEKNMSDDLSEAFALVVARDKLLLKISNKSPQATLETLERRSRVRRLLKQFNEYEPPEFRADMGAVDLTGAAKQLQVLAELFNMSVHRALFLAIEAPIRVHNGTNVHFHGSFFSNPGLLMMDEGEINIGTRVIVGPNVQLVATSHPIDVAERRTYAVNGEPITIGNDVWIGAGAIIVGPCTIGNGVTVAAGAVVKGTIPDNVVVGGVPARIIKHLTPPPEHESPIEFTKIFNKEPTTEETTA